MKRSEEEEVEVRSSFEASATKKGKSAIGTNTDITFPIPYLQIAQNNKENVGATEQRFQRAELRTILHLVSCCSSSRPICMTMPLSLHIDVLV